MFKEFLLAFVAIFAALDIIGTLPLYLSMTSNMKLKERALIVNKSMLVAFIVALVFIFAGQKVFSSLGINLFDFKIAGGIVLLLVALADLVGGPGLVRPKSDSTGIVPLAVPLITGPGVLTTLILQVSAVGHALTVLALLINYTFAWVLLRKADYVTKLIGKEGTIVISKIAALLLAAIAVAMIRGGIFDAIEMFRSATG